MKIRGIGIKRIALLSDLETKGTCAPEHFGFRTRRHNMLPMLLSKRLVEWSKVGERLIITQKGKMILK